MTSNKVEKMYQDHTKIIAGDEVCPGGATFEFKIIPTTENVNFIQKILFQNGTIPEAGVNGCTTEDLLEICRHRLHQFQSGPFSCRENALALTKVEEALMWLNQRTRDRKLRGVEGENLK